MHGRGFREIIAPTGLAIDRVEFAAGQISITGRSGSPVSICPSCRRPSARVHSRYLRTLADLPSHGRPVRITLAARRFRCTTSGCGKRIFVERFPQEVAAAFARRTSRLDSIVHHLGLALGGRPAASLARRLLIPVSKDTLLRTVRRRSVALRQSQQSSVSMTGHGSGGSDMARSSAIWNVDALSIYSPIAASPPWKRGSRPGLRSASSRVIAAAHIDMQPRAPCRTLFRLPIVGI